MRALLPVPVLALLATAAALPAEEARILRFPDVHGDTVAFVHAGDVWTASTAGGPARRLTTGEGMELFPKFSPDGRSIAYSAEYAGNRQLYVISVDGGTPRQLTYYNDVGPMPPRGGFDYRVLDWTPDGEEILFRANRLPWGVRMGRPYVIPAAGGMERPLAVPEGGGGMLSPDGTKLVYTPIDREFRTWKRYEGGRQQDVWIYDLAADTARQLTTWKGTDNQPVWVGDTIYYTSDRAGGRLNLWAQPASGGEERQVTFHEDFDVLWPSAGPDAVVYESAGWLWRHDPASGESARVPVEIASDSLHVLPAWRKVAGEIEDGDISPSGKRAVFSARGDVYTVPAEHGAPRNLTRSQGVREHGATWSPDGRRVAYLSDRTGEYEIWVRPADGSGEERRVTSGGDTWKFAPAWSPDSEKLAYGDRRQRLLVVDVESGEVTVADSSDRNDIDDYRWAPDSRWIVYTKVDPSQSPSLFVYSLDAGEVVRLTDELTNDYEPVFDPEGRYLYFLSDRDYSPTFSDFEFNYVYTDPTRVYAALLHPEAPPLLRPKVDEETPAGEDEGDGEEAKDGETGDGGEDEGNGEDDGPPEVRIEADGFGDRVVALPGSPGDYRSLAATAGGVLFIEGQGGESKLQLFSLEKEETETVLAGVQAYELAAGGEKLLVWTGGEKYAIVDAAPGASADDGALDVEAMEMKVDFLAEWRQIFVDGWRITRDWFYDPGMHGLDWQGVRAMYEPWVDHVRHRGDLDYVLGEMGGELSAGHFYVNWGDMPAPERVENGLLGAEIEAHDSGFFRVARVLPGENWHDDFRSPLTEAGVDVEAGEFLLAVDGRDAREVDNFYRLLEREAGDVVTLTVNDEPTFDGSREVRVEPIARETNLRYLEWTAERRRRVEEMSDGRIGYIHLPNTAFEGNRELRKWFFPQAHKEALVVDVRYNGGGFIPDQMAGLLDRDLLSLWARRGIVPFTSPGFYHDGPKVCLINGYSSSGGDAFPYYFAKLDLGPLYGTRTWGGLIGISGNPGFVDGGSINVPTFRFFTTEGEWAVEREGVAPDVEVVDRPDLVARGEDPTLEAAVEYLLEQLDAAQVEEIDEPEPPTIPRDG